MKQPNLYPSDPTERALAEKIVGARMASMLRAPYRARHAAHACDPMEGFCAQLSSAFFSAMGGKNGPYALFRIKREHLGGDDTHYFLVDTRKLPAGWQKKGPTKAFVEAGAPRSLVVDLTASQFDFSIPYHLGQRAALSQREGGDVNPTKSAQKILERAGLHGRSGGLVGARQMPIEDVPDDAFDRTLPRELAVAPWQHEVMGAALSIYAPGRSELRIKRVRPKGSGVFGGRWLPEPIGIVVYWHGDREIERGVLLHEICHYLRWLYTGDEPGYHNEGFLALVEDVYRTFRVPCSTAKLIEGQYPDSWKW